MRRPVAFLCGAYVSGITVEFFLKLNNGMLFIMGVCATGTIIVSAYFYRNNRLRLNKRQLCLYFIAIILGISGAIQFSYQMHQEGVLEKNQGEYLQIRGKVISITEKDEENHKMIVLVRNLEGTGKLSEEERILVNIYGECPEYYKYQGKMVQTAGFIELPTPRRNPKTFDYKMYLKTKKIAVLMSVKPENIQVSDKRYNYYLNYISRIKYIFKCNISGILEDKIAGLLMGMLFGDNSGVEEELYETFQKNGICHVLSVSGLHVGCLYACMNALLGGKRNLRFYTIIIFVLFFYASLANFSPTVMRALIMIILHIISKYMYCRYDMFTSGAVTMAVMLFFNPMSLLNLGFQLSFLAIFSLAVIIPAAERICNKSVAGVLSIQAGMAPISAFAFNYFSFSSFIANIPVIFVSGILIPLGILLLFLSTIAMIIPEFWGFYDFLRSIFQITGILIEFFSKLLLFINDLSFIDKVSYKYTVSPPLWAMILYYCILFFISSEAFRIMWQRKHYKNIIKILMVIVFIALVFSNALKDGFEQVQLTFVDVGQGDCLLIKTKEGKTVLIDSGGSSQYDVGKKVLLPYLLKNGIKQIDFAIVTHLHTDHVGGLYTLARELPVKKLGVYEGNKLIADRIKEKSGIAEKDFVYLTKGQNLKIGKSLKIQILFPEKKTMEEYSEFLSNQRDENAGCLVMKITLEGVSVIMTGDIDTTGEKQIIESNSVNNLKADVLKVAHHGSRYGSSAAFLQAVRPHIAVIQVGKNTYGHPNEKTLQNLKQRVQGSIEMIQMELWA
ncbi:DNA internalization-related competence protein ComEC/Rec2 [Aminipila terrae]|uniref:DNA internalization-related competence protein ComEC/Rec2 n=1 Tax=Aminipila terrae TaxID=2697030 RepID=A0A6P1MQR7_9FIRM|nr:DNA internalization-related competence protein ComEC/Rec2 [Aminipila terrae]QHI73345.1 DNA internalization-related competence protein ComEC/Rec2 [Aminipila terrae]